VAAWCQEHGVGTAGVSFVAEPSERALPALADDLLDLVIIDGCHAFPWPFLDWFFTAEKLRVGGLLIVDDVQLRTGALLRDFLKAEAGRWSLERDFRTASLFRKTSEGVLAGIWWGAQPWGAKPIPRWRRRLQVARQRLSAGMRSRS
jgi:hypothetical protein